MWNIISKRMQTSIKNLVYSIHRPGRLMRGAAACEEINTHKSWLHAEYWITGKQIENEASRSLEDGGPLFCSAASLFLSLSMSLCSPPSCEALPAHTMCNMDCHLESDPEDHEQPTLACTLHPHHTHTSTSPSYLNKEMHRPLRHASQIFLS